MAVAYGVAGIISLALLTPIVLMFLASLKGQTETRHGSVSILPAHPTLESYADIFLRSPMPRYLANSLIISVTTTAVVLLFAVPATYGIVHYRYRGVGAATGLLLATRVVPPVGLIAPFFILLARLGLINTYAGLILLDIFLCYPLSIWLLKPFFQSFPHDLLWAALVDGCGRLRAFVSVVLPILKSGIWAVTTFVFLWTWNEFLFALIFSTSPTVQPVTVGLEFFIGDEYVSWNDLTAGSLVASVPGLVLFAFAQRSIVSGIAAGALK